MKEGRKIYVTVSMKNPPVIKMPKLTDGSVKNAQMILKSYDLVVGQLKFVPNIQKDAVLRQLVNGKEIAAGAPITKGTRVDLEVGDGLGNQEFPVPNLVNMPADEATTLLVGQGLQVGEIFYQSAPQRRNRWHRDEAAPRTQPRHHHPHGPARGPVGGRLGAAQGSGLIQLLATAPFGAPAGMALRLLNTEMAQGSLYTSEPCAIFARVVAGSFRFAYHDTPPARRGRPQRPVKPLRVTGGRVAANAWMLFRP